MSAALPGVYDTPVVLRNPFTTLSPYAHTSPNMIRLPQSVLPCTSSIASNICCPKIPSLAHPAGSPVRANS